MGFVDVNTAAAKRSSSFREEVNFATSSRTDDSRPPCSIFDTSLTPVCSIVNLGFLCFFSRFFARFFECIVHSCLQPPEFNEAFRVGLVECGFDVVVGKVLVVE